MPEEAREKEKNYCFGAGAAPIGGQRRPRPEARAAAHAAAATAAAAAVVVSHQPKKLK